MTTDLLMLVYSAVLCVLLAFPYTLALIRQVGPFRAVAYPQPTHDDMSNWVQRSKRAHMNMVENLSIFAAIVLVVHVAGMANPMTAMGAQVFFWARIVMAVGHIGGIPGLRSVSWFVSLAGLMIILLQVL
jgi:uncharacterized MAPEG superfamily protein